MKEFALKFGFTPTCQSKQIESSPRPSFPLLPPKTREATALFGAARQIMDNPVRSGKIHSGKSSQIKILGWLANLAYWEGRLIEGLTWRIQCKRL